LRKNFPRTEIEECRKTVARNILHQPRLAEFLTTNDAADKALPNAASLRAPASGSATSSATVRNSRMDTHSAKK
jgi:hypothetical protein